MREVVLDTETTGLDPASGHRIIEIGGVELLNHVATGSVFQTYLDPQREVPPEAFAVHGLSTAFLKGKPLFADTADGLLQFLADSRLVIHNAAFDLGFLNAELRRIGRETIRRERCIDTVEMARQKHPGAPASLDALCRRYQIDLTDRTMHGALKDSKLLAQVYLELCGGREPGLAFVSTKTKRLAGLYASGWMPKLVPPSTVETDAHRAFMTTIKDALWREVESPAEAACPTEPVR
ncbi:MAG TPA: DNA polymerase III subunit epsilon [Rhodospirillales bacterium]|nr:DNA polymerase III subunit epsilon [Rhodospirillales bacterium]